MPNPRGHSTCPSAKRLDLSLSLLPHLKLVANRSGLRSPSAFSPVDFKAFLKVDIYYLPISTVDLSIEIWSNAYTRCTMAGFHQIGFMFPACCDISLKLWAHSVWYGGKKGKTSVCFLMVMVCSCWSAWDLQALTPCCNERGIVTAGSVPRSCKFPPCGRKMFQSLSLPRLLLESLRPHLASAGGEGPAPTLQGSGKRLDLYWRGRRLRGNENEIFSWSLEMSYFKHAISFPWHKYFPSIIYFLPGSMIKPSAVLSNGTNFGGAQLSQLCFLPEPE